MNPVPSDELLNAYIDGELDVVEREALIARLRGDTELAQRVCGLRNLRDMVRLAYAAPPAVARTAPRRLGRQRRAFGCLVLLAGLGGGWLLHGLEAGRVTAQPVLVPGYQEVSLAAAADPNRILLHLDSSAPDKMQTLLDQAERLLDQAARQGRAVQLEVIANSHGIDLLRVGMSPHAARIARLHQRHANLQWVACSQSVARFRHEGQQVELLPAAHTAPTAIGEIVTRLQQGWTYVRV